MAGATKPVVNGAMLPLSAMVFIVSLGYGAGLPLIRPYLLRYLCAVPASTVAWHVGMLGGVHLFALFLFAPLWGRLLDRHGRVGVAAPIQPTHPAQGGLASEALAQRFDLEGQQAQGTPLFATTGGSSRRVVMER
jgi:MFS family permease